MLNNKKEKMINEMRLIKKNSRRLIKYLNANNSKLQQQKLKKEITEMERLIKKFIKTYKLTTRKCTA